jgi:hypothetical protein
VIQITVIAAEIADESTLLSTIPCA